MGKCLTASRRSERSRTERGLTLCRNVLDGTVAVTKREHLQTPTPASVPAVITAKCVGYVNALKSEVWDPGRHNGRPYFPAAAWALLWASCHRFPEFAPQRAIRLDAEMKWQNESNGDHADGDEGVRTSVCRHMWKRFCLSVNICVFVLRMYCTCVRAERENTRVCVPAFPINRSDFTTNLIRSHLSRWKEPWLSTRLIYRSGVRSRMAGGGEILYVQPLLPKTKKNHKNTKRS